MPGDEAGEDRRLDLVIRGDVAVKSTGAIKTGTYNTNNKSLSKDEFKGHIYNNISDTLTGPFYIKRRSNGYGSFESKLPFRRNTYHQIHHRVYIGGSFTNEGSVRFHNLQTIDLDQLSGWDGKNALTTGAATVFFQGASHETLTCNGTTDFYNLVLNKGTDPTYSLTINSNDYTHFRLWGPTSVGADLDSLGANNPNLIMRKSLWIRNGTLKLTGKTAIVSLSEAADDDNVGKSIQGGKPGPSDPSGDFYIPANGALVLDGPEVIVLSTADYASEIDVAYGFPLGSTQGVLLAQRSGNQSLSVYGALTVNSGYLSSRESGGIIYWAVKGGAGNVTINGGVVDAKQFRSSEQTGNNAGRITFAITGGVTLARAFPEFRRHLQCESD